MIVIQHTQQIWGKNERGSEFANERSKLPWVAQVPSMTSTHAMLIHLRGMHRLKQPGPFKEVDLVKEFQKDDKYWTFKFDLNSGELNAYFHFDYQEHGAPKRRGFEYAKRPIFKVKLEESVQFTINGRHVYHSHTYYSKNVVNIAYGEFSNSVFLDRDFKRKINLERSLF